MLIPDQETAVDFLNYEAVAKTVVALLKDNRQHALTIGIHGDWGAGKSSVLKMVESSMSGDSKVACLWFNGWTFQGFDDAKTVLIEVIVSELIRQRSTYGKVREKGLKLLKRINDMKLARYGAASESFSRPASRRILRRRRLAGFTTWLRTSGRCHRTTSEARSTRLQDS